MTFEIMRRLFRHILEALKPKNKVNTGNRLKPGRRQQLKALTTAIGLFDNNFSRLVAKSGTLGDYAQQRC